MIGKIALFLLSFFISYLETCAQVSDEQKNNVENVSSAKNHHKFKSIDFKDSLKSILKDSSINVGDKNTLKIIDVRSIAYDGISSYGDLIFDERSILTKSGEIITVDYNDFTDFSKSFFYVLYPDSATVVRKSMMLPKPATVASYKEDADGNIYLVGNFDGVSKVDSFTYSYDDAFIAKYNSKLQLVGLKKYSNNIFLGFTIDSKGDFYISGEDSSVFCMKIDVEFKTIWKKNIHLPKDGREFVHSEMVVKNTNLYFTIDKSEPFIDMLVLNSYIVNLDANSGKLIYNREIAHDVSPSEFIKLFLDDNSNVHLSCYSRGQSFLEKLGQKKSFSSTDSLGPLVYMILF